MANGVLGYTANSGGPKSAWYLARGAGFAIFGLLTLAVACGIFMSLKWKPHQGLWLICEKAHPLLLLTAAVALSLHILGLLLISFPVDEALIPFISSFRAVSLGFGIVSAYIGIVLLGSTYLIHQIGFRVWRYVHYLGLLGWILALAHGMQTGHDSGASSAVAYYMAGLVIVGVLVALRITKQIVVLRAPVPAHGAH